MGPRDRLTECYDDLCAVATQAFFGRRKEQYPTEFVLTFRLLDSGVVARAALGAHQKFSGLKVDCWPSETVLLWLSAAR